jgi:hypothetical protein
VAAAPFIGTIRAQPIRAADTPDAALKLLLEGNERYLSNQTNERVFSASRATPMDLPAWSMARPFSERRSSWFSVIPVAAP